MKTLLIIASFLLLTSPVIAQVDVDIESVLGTGDKYATRTYSNIQASSYDNYYNEEEYRLLCEGDFDLIYDPLNHVKNINIECIFLYYLYYVDKYCHSILGENTIKVNKTYYDSEKVYAGTDYSYDGTFIYSQDKYETKTYTYYIEMEISPNNKIIFNYCDKKIEEQPFYFTELINENSTSDIGKLPRLDIRKFFKEEIKCDKRTLETMRENIVRLLEGRQSLQQEKGIY
ncbi:MAG: hypothetical protein R2757_22375 [Draconibacterium sp.]